MSGVYNVTSNIPYTPPAVSGGGATSGAQGGGNLSALVEEIEQLLQSASQGGTGSTGSTGSTGGTGSTGNSDTSGLHQVGIDGGQNQLLEDSGGNLYSNSGQELGKVNSNGTITFNDENDAAQALGGQQAVVGGETAGTLTAGSNGYTLSGGAAQVTAGNLPGAPT
ncbi:MAG: hypothetical protein QOI13_2889 [Paraburkholderia sp.]|jgi:hypothetical protein|nr:hypothetical protein [Paraburkholderia sp.]